MCTDMGIDMGMQCDLTSCCKMKESPSVTATPKPSECYSNKAMENLNCLTGSSKEANNCIGFWYIIDALIIPFNG